MQAIRLAAVDIDFVDNGTTAGDDADRLAAGYRPPIWSRRLSTRAGGQ